MPKLTPPPVPKYWPMHIPGVANAVAARDEQWAAIAQPLLDALIDCIDDSREAARLYEQSYQGYRPARLAALKKTVADAEAAISEATKEPQ